MRERGAFLGAGGCYLVCGNVYASNLNYKEKVAADFRLRTSRLSWGRAGEVMSLQLVPVSLDVAMALVNYGVDRRYTN